MAGTLQLPTNTQFFLLSPPRLPCSKFRTESCSPPSRKVGLILCYLSLLLNIGYAWHVDEIISNQWRHGSTDARAVGSFKNVKSLTYLSGKQQNHGKLPPWLAVSRRILETVLSRMQENDISALTYQHFYHNVLIRL